MRTLHSKSDARHLQWRLSRVLASSRVHGAVLFCSSWSTSWTSPALASSSYARRRGSCCTCLRVFAVHTCCSAGRVRLVVKRTARQERRRRMFVVGRAPTVQDRDAAASCVAPRSRSSLASRCFVIFTRFSRCVGAWWVRACVGRGLPRPAIPCDLVTPLPTHLPPGTHSVRTPIAFGAGSPTPSPVRGRQVRRVTASELCVHSFSPAASRSRGREDRTILGSRSIGCCGASAALTT